MSVNLDILKHAIEHPTPHIRSRAQIILMTLEGKDTSTIAGEIGLTARTVQKWQDAWERDGLEIFPEDVRTIPPTPQPDEPIPITQDILPHLHGVIAELPPVEPSDPMWEAGRKILLADLVYMLKHEPTAVEGVDLEGVHQMRVGIRRIRSVFDVFGEYFDRKRYAGITKGSQRTGKRLGAVRDLDVFLEKTYVYINTQLEGNADTLQPMLNLIIDKRDKARKRMLDWLGSKQYEQFIQDFYELVKEPDTSGHKKYRKQSTEPLAFKVNHVGPRLLYGQIETVWAYEPFLDGASPEMLHALRIEFKRLRYIFEFFDDLLGKDGERVIDSTRKMQNYLGDFNDAAVSLEFMESLLGDLPEDQRAGIHAYMDYRRKEYKNLYKGFAKVWRKFNRTGVKKALADAIARIMIADRINDTV
ncbi:MAG: CHAD domain-containing protein [Chloroflexi bacterium]|nr:CHAD domain-containing protein [Chloroflexota bacterium]